MRAFAAVLGTALLLGLLWWLWPPAATGVPAPTDLVEDPVAASPALPATGALDRQEATAPPVDEPAASMPPSTSAPGAPASAATPMVRISLRAIDEVTQQPVEKFSLVLRGSTGRQVLATTDGSIEFAAQPRESVQLLVEAEGYDPSQSSVMYHDPNAEPLPMVISLRRAAGPAAGITLHVRDGNQEPIGNVVVQVFRRSGEAGDATWRLGAPLWSRHNRRPDGIYTLPSLGAGSFVVRVLSADALGNVQPTLPYEGSFELTGSNGYVEHVTLESACIPEFECVDRYGQPLPAPAPTTRLRLRSPGGPDMARAWLARVDDRLHRAIDQLPGAGPIWPELPVAAGTWELLLERDDRAPYRELVTLPAGERPRLRIATPW